MKCCDRHRLLAALLTVAATQGAIAQSPEFPRPGLLEPADLDTTCAPCRDFYQFANGGWLASHPIPPAQSIWGTWDEVAAHTDTVLRRILEAPPGDTAARHSGELRLVQGFYGSCMDTTRINSDGARSILPELQRLPGIKTAAGLADALARLHRQRIDVLFRFEAAPDFKRSTRVIGQLSQGGMELPDPDQYRSPEGDTLRQAYHAHIVAMLELLGSDRDEARRDADLALAVETELASVSMGAAQRRDPNAVYHLMTRAELRRLAPGFPWDRYFTGLGLSRLSVINVAQPDFIGRVGRLVAESPAATWSAYLRWRLLDRLAPALSDPFLAEDFRFRRTLTGESAQLPRWSRCLRSTESVLGQALGKEYVARALSLRARAAATELVVNLQAVLRSRLQSLGWMSHSTRVQALVKLDSLGRTIGYPRRWRDYSALVLDGESYARNLLRAREFESRHEFAKIGHPVDRDDWWDVTPQRVDAYYSSFTNEIVLPAGMLQPPFFDVEASDAVNYGAIGALVGHELTHAFDDRGRRFDARGNLRDWWTREDEERFAQRAGHLVEQFNGYFAVDSARVNGRLTLGENIADLGGLGIAYQALQRSKAAGSHPTSGQFTADQQFFLAWARMRRANIRPEMARLLARVDRHAPRRWRVNGPLSNMPEFARAFGCNAGDPMVRADSLQAAIW